MFAALEASIKSFVGRLDGEAVHIAEEARDAALTELQAVKAEVVKAGPIVQAAEADLRQIVAAAAPELKAAVESRLGQLVQEVLALIGAPTGM